METTDSSPPTGSQHGVPFRTLAVRDRLIGATLLLLAAAIVVEACSVTAIFLSRSRFGTRFDVESFDGWRRAKSDIEVDNTLKRTEAQKKRAEILRPVTNDASAFLAQRAVVEHQVMRATVDEDRLIRNLNEKTAEDLVREATVATEAGKTAGAIVILKQALANTPDYMPAIRELALLYEQQQDYPQASFQWQKAATVAAPGSPDLGEIQGNLNRVSRLAEDERSRRATLSKPAVPLRWDTPNRQGPPPPTPTGITVGDIIRKDLELEYGGRAMDVRFQLQIPLSSRGSDAWVELRALQVKIAFYNQVRSSGGETRALLALADTVEPGREPWATGTQRICLINFHLEKNYLRSHRARHGDSFQFAGYVVRVYYRGNLMDERSVPDSLLGMLSSEPNARGGDS